MRSAKDANFRVDFYASAGWVTAVVTELKTGLKAQATAGNEKAARSAALHKLSLARKRGGSRGAGTPRSS